MDVRNLTRLIQGGTAMMKTRMHRAFFKPIQTLTLLFWSFVFLVTTALFFNSESVADEYTVYQVFRSIDLGESDQLPPKDVFINMGSEQGVKKGSVLDVYRKISSFDNLTQKHMGDLVIPVGRVKVIHAEAKNSIARLDKFVTLDSEPALLPQAIMMGDLVRMSR